MERLTYPRNGGPYLPRRGSLVATWAVTVVGLGALLVAAGASKGRLDDRDPAHQRPGLLDAFDLPAPAPALDATLPAAGARTVVLFTRRDGLTELCAALERDQLTARATTVVVVAGPAHPCPPASAVIADADGRDASRYGMRRPLDGGPPVGYAVVDRERRIRYRTLDPGFASRLSEIRTMVAAVP